MCVVCRSLKVETLVLKTTIISQFDTHYVRCRIVGAAERGSHGGVIRVQCATCCFRVPPETFVIEES